MYTTTKPVIIRFQSNSLITGKYYYYRLVANNVTIYFGKTFCVGTPGIPTVELDLRRILQANAYNGQYSLKPVYDLTKQIYTPSFADRKAFADTDIMQQYTIKLESDLQGTVVAQETFMVTSAYDLITEMPDQSHISRFIQPLAYRTSLIPHYPNVMTDLYGIYFFVEYKYGQTYWVYLLDQPTWSSEFNYQLTTSANLDSSTHTGQRNTLPFNISLSYFYNYITSHFNGTQIQSNFIQLGNASTNYSDVINLGNAKTKYSDVIDLGDATSTGQQSVIRPFTGDLYVTTNGAGETPVQVAHIDACTKDYYLAWQTHSGAPFSYGFDGNTVKKSNVDRTIISNYSNFDSVAMIEQRYEFELRSGIVSKELYELFGDIFDSPYLYLYSTKEDKSWYCTLQDNDFTYKKIKTERRPLDLTLNLKECSSINK